MILETTTYDFKTHLSRYIADLEAGKYEKILVKRREKVVGEFTAHSKPAGGIQLGGLTGLDGNDIDAAFAPSLEQDIEKIFDGSDALD